MASGSVGAGSRTPDDLAAQIAAVRDLTPAPFGVNVFVPRRDPVNPEALDAYVRSLAAEAATLGVEVGEARDEDDAWDAKIALLMRDPVPVVSFTFACPPADVVAALRDAGSEVWVTVTGAAEARRPPRRARRRWCARGRRRAATAARGTTATTPSRSGCWRCCGSRRRPPTSRWWRRAASPTAPAWRRCWPRARAPPRWAPRSCGPPEAGTHPAHRAALAGGGRTGLTRAFTGRTARGIVNRFMEEHEADAVVAYPQVHHATSPLRAAARKSGDAGGFNLWAGQAHVLAREAPAGEIVETVAAEAAAAARAAVERLRSPGG